MKPIDKIITDEQINKAWGNARFGDTPRREIILEALLKCVKGYSTGHTIACILMELDLADKVPGPLTIRGLEYLISAVQQNVVINLPTDEEIKKYALDWAESDKGHGPDKYFADCNFKSGARWMRKEISNKIFGTKLMAFLSK